MLVWPCQRTTEPSGGEGKASTTAAAVTTRSAAKSVALGGLVTSPSEGGKVSRCKR